MDPDAAVGWANRVTLKPFVVFHMRVGWGRMPTKLFALGSWPTVTVAFTTTLPAATDIICTSSGAHLAIVDAAILYWDLKMPMRPGMELRKGNDRAPNVVETSMTIPPPVVGLAEEGAIVAGEALGLEVAGH